MASRSLLTVLFTDIVESTKRVVRDGDKRWREVLDSHDAAVRSAIRAHAGRAVNTTGDGFLVTFTSPTAAIDCALAIMDAASGVALQVRAGLHTGEVERRGRDVAGVGVNIAARIAGRAEAYEILVSETVRDLAAGADVEFLPRGSYTLKGLTGRRRLYAVSSRGPAPIRVIIADDHPLWRETLKGLLEHGGSACVVGEAGTGDEALEVAAAVAADVILMDIDMPQRDGIDAARAVTELGDRPKVLMLSSIKEREEVAASVRAGACGYVLKTAGRDEVIDAVRRVHRGELAFPPELASIVLSELRGAAGNGGVAAATYPGGLASLTPREREVLGLIAEGSSNQAIAARLHLSTKTIEVHIGAVFTKLGLEPSNDQHRRVQAAVMFLSDSSKSRRR